MEIVLIQKIGTPAMIMGQDHRIGRIIEGFDAGNVLRYSRCFLSTYVRLDVVVWDSHPLALGATPKQVFIDGIAQLENPYTSRKPESAQHVPDTPDFEKEISDAIKYEGLPPLEPETAKSDVVVFWNVGSIFLKNKTTRGISEVFTSALKDGVLVFENGRIACSGSLEACPGALSYSNALYLNLEGGSI
jgi:hypothetical protein